MQRFKIVFALKLKIFLITFIAVTALNLSNLQSLCVGYMRIGLLFYATLKLPKNSK